GDAGQDQERWPRGKAQVQPGDGHQQSGRGHYRPTAESRGQHHGAQPAERSRRQADSKGQTDQPGCESGALEVKAYQHRREAEAKGPQPPRREAKRPVGSQRRRSRATAMPAPAAAATPATRITTASGNPPDPEPDAVAVEASVGRALGLGDA